VKLAMWSEFHDTVAALPDDERRLFDLLFYQGLTLPDAGHLLGVPPPTLKYKWQDARTRMMLRFRNDPPL
jgi:DNA-directed RNA polymerase specialized sigma24 family protein